MARDREIEYIMSLKDDATAAYKKFVGEVERGSVSMQSMAKTAGTAIAGMFSVYAASQFITKYNDAQAVVAALDQQLKNQGITNREVLNGLIEHANALKAKTAIDDEEIIAVQTKVFALTQNLNAVNKLTPAILDLSAGLKMNAEDAATLVARTLKGDDAMSRYGIKIGETVTQQERLEKIITEVNKAVGGQAEAFAQTDAGKLQAAALAMDDLQKSMGKMLNDVVIPMAPQVTHIMNVIGEELPKVMMKAQGTMARTLQLIIAPFGVIQEYLGKMGVNAGHQLHNLFYELDFIREQATKVGTETEGAATSVGNLGNSTGRTSVETKTWKEKLEELNKELDRLTPGSDAWIAKMTKIKSMQEQVALATEKATLAAKGATGTTLLDLNFSKGFSTQLQAMNNDAAQFFKDFNKQSSKMFGGEVDPQALKAVEDQAAIMQEIKLRSITDGKQKELAILDEWEQNAIAMAHGREDIITEISKVAAQERAKIEQQYQLETYQQAASLAQQAIGLYQQAVAQASQSAVQFIEKQRANELKGLDREKEAIKRKYQSLMDNEQLTAEQKDALRKQQQEEEEKLLSRKEAIEENYNARIAAEKTRAFEKQKTAQMIASIINTAVEITKVLATPWMIPIVAGLGVAQTALIASQPTPSFHTGGAGFFNAPPSQETFVKIRGQEHIDVYTPEQRNAMNAARGITLVVNFNAPVSDEQFVTNSIKKVLKETGLPIDKAFIDQSSNVVLQ